MLARNTYLPVVSPILVALATRVMVEVGRMWLRRTLTEVLRRELS
jgi:hypothetical protein